MLLFWPSGPYLPTPFLAMKSQKISAPKKLSKKKLSKISDGKILSRSFIQNVHDLFYVTIYY